MYHLTKNGKFINYAVQTAYSDGPYVICLTQSLRVAQTVAQSEKMSDENGEYCVGRVIPFEATQEVWLGFPFTHRGAKTLIRDQVTDEQYEELLRETDMATQS
jgi:hypothetical protein